MIVVTGGAGFVGRALVNYLIESGEEVKIFDNFSNSSKSKIQQLLKKGASLVEGDIRNYQNLERGLSKCDTIIHLAAQIDVQKSIINPKENYEINVDGTKNLLKACLKQNGIFYRINDVFNEYEVSCIRPITKDDKRFIFSDIFHKLCNYSSICICLSLSIYVKKS